MPDFPSFRATVIFYFTTVAWGIMVHVVDRAMRNSVLRRLLLFVFSPKVTLWTDAILLGGWLSLIQLHQFAASYATITIATVLFIGMWLNSKALRKSRPTKKKLPSENGARLLRRFVILKVSVCIIISAVGLGFLYMTFSLENDYALGLLFGKLYPADDPLSSWCSPQEGEVALKVGTVAVQVREQFLPIGLVALGKKRIITLDKDPDGAFVVVADIKDGNGKLIVRLDRDEFRVNPNNFFSVKRKDRSSLSVVDQEGNAILNARFVNPRSFEMTGKLYAEGRLIDFTNGLDVGRTMSWDNTCIDVRGEPGPDYAVFGIE